MESKLKIEAGKYYRTRDGRKAYVAAVRTDYPSYPIIGWFEGHPTCAWGSGGRVYATNREAYDDLVAEWKEPLKVECWGIFNKRTGLLFRAVNTQILADADNPDPDRYIVIKLTGTEGVE